MPRSSISVTTDKRALKRLNRQFSVELPEAVKKELREAMPIIGMQFQAEARKLVPERSGETSNAISYEVDSAGLAVNLFVDGSKMTIPQNAIWQEFGTVKMPPNSYWYPAWRLKQRAFKARLKRAAKKGAQSI